VRPRWRLPLLAAALAAAALVWTAWDRHRDGTAPLASGSPRLSAHYDPLAAARAETRIGNVEAGIPAQCYTDPAAGRNPCWVCHTGANGRTRTDDLDRQRYYRFTPRARRNPWDNLFVDRRAGIAAIDDDEILAYIRQDNVAPLRAALRDIPQKLAWRPDLDYTLGFDDGFARDGSGWRAFRYKPVPAAFWPTNGATDDVLVRLPDRFRQDAVHQPSRMIYRINLALLEAAVAIADTVADADLTLPTEPLDETVAGLDLDGDGTLGTASTIRGLPSHYVGAASDEPLRRYDYPVGTEFLHGVRYIDPDAPDLLSRRFKELRYAVKRAHLDDAALQRRVDEDAVAQQIGAIPRYAGTAFTGQTNDYAWRLFGYIEDAEGRLRLQTREEQLYCMGCHTGIGVTVDQTFSLPRKVPGAAGWGLQHLAGIQDVPQAGSDTPEILQFLRRAGGGDEFHANDEMLQRFFPAGVLDERIVRRAAPGGDADIRSLIAPSRARALALNKAYRMIVREQRYRLGRTPLLQPATQVLRQIERDDTGLDAAGKVYADGRLWLNWTSAGPSP